MTVDLNVPPELDMPAGRLAARREHLLRETAGPAPSLRTRGRRTLALGLTAAVLAAVGAGAATGVLPVGSEIPAPGVFGEGEPPYTSDLTVVATGVTSDGLHWRMTVARTSDQGFCVGLTLLDTAVGDDGFDACGRSPSFDALGVGGGDVLPDKTLVFGPVPEQAAAVRITAPGGFARSITGLADGPDDVPGRFYLAEIPRTARDVLVHWVTEDGTVKEPGAVVEATIRYSRQPPKAERPG